MTAEGRGVPSAKTEPYWGMALTGCFCHIPLDLATPVVSPAPAVKRLLFFFQTRQGTCPLQQAPDAKVSNGNPARVGDHQTVLSNPDPLRPGSGDGEELRGTRALGVDNQKNRQYSRVFTCR